MILGGRNAEESLESRIRRVLQAGVWTSFALLLMGIVAWFAQHPDSRSLADLVWDEGRIGLAWAPGLMRGEGSSLVMLGLWVLVLTPWFRVVSAATWYLETRDRVFLALTGLVGLLMVLSWILGTMQG